MSSPAEELFEPVNRSTISGQIRDRLLERITSGKLEAGARVPSERALSEQFQVARTSVREAMQGLLSLGVIERRGNRSFVAERLPDVSFDAIDDRKEYIRQLFETRRLIEVPITELAAERASRSERETIAKLPAHFFAGMPIQEFRDRDRQFHGTIARASHNPILTEVYDKVLARLFGARGLESILVDQANEAEMGRIIEEATEQHREIAERVCAADGPGAAKAAAEHLASVEWRIIGHMI